ncbi:hypothetical protein F6A13_03675 [Acidithiobacillus sp. 'AMD consortium']|uniref:hypothetical protein n=1 Tax=Acidithiobacillus sp. 'AMD consortium' TaxID=2614801 RepID=UPI00124D9F78|nr:hypothetical protein [Acidithiobacillus sp. 'AMD consortium']QFG77835.1 hypothetical protein F6A13_03675 [Acidithiobacillus sp. 'AMD consortium']
MKQRSIMAGQCECPVAQCDIHDKAMLQTYREKRTRWLGWLQADPYHPIWSQIVALVDEDLMGRTIACAAENDPESPLHNPMIKRMIVNGHRDAQVLGLRRLMSKGNNVISLHRLLSDMKGHSDVFTREIYVAGCGLPYDISIASASPSLPNFPSRAIPGSAFVSLDGPYGQSVRSEAAHQQFDRLSMTTSDTRKRFDRIPNALFALLEKHIKGSGIDDIIKWSHQFIAHPGDATAQGWQDLQITFDKVEVAQRSIVQVIHLISGAILQGPVLFGIVPVAQYSRFARLEKMVDPGALKQARAKWKELENDRNSWLLSETPRDLLDVIGWA